MFRTVAEEGIRLKITSFPGFRLKAGVHRALEENPPATTTPFSMVSVAFATETVLAR